MIYSSVRDAKFIRILKIRCVVSVSTCIYSHSIWDIHSEASSQRSLVRMWIHPAYANYMQIFGVICDALIWSFYSLYFHFKLPSREYPIFESDSWLSSIRLIAMFSIRNFIILHHHSALIMNGFQWVWKVISFPIWSNWSCSNMTPWESIPDTARAVA